MSRIAILYIYHDRAAMCASRLRVLRALNPGVDIYGLYGGTRERRAEFAAVEALLDDAWACEHGDGPWRWRNIDKMMDLWYQERGQYRDWSVLFEHQADLLVANSVSTYTALTPGPRDMLFYRNPLGFRVLERLQWPWLSVGLDELRGFMNHLHARYGSDEAFCGQNIFFTIASRSFFEEFIGQVFPVPGVVEYRSPSLARAAGYRLVDYHPPQADVNCMSFATGHQPLERVLSELASATGARMFHRVIDAVEPEQITDLLEAATRAC